MSDTQVNIFDSVDRFVKRKNEKLYGEYRTKRVILEIYNEMRMAMETGEAYRTRLVPGPADAAVAHEGRMGAAMQASIEGSN